MKALYDLSTDLLTFDFFHFVPMAVGRGATEIVIKTSGEWRESIYPREKLERRLDSIIRPGPALFGLPCSEGEDGERIGRCKAQDFMDFVKCRNGQFRRARSVLPPGRAKYTVTLRNQHKSTWRNSREAVWRRFARKIGAVVIEDYDDQPMHLHERMALYAGAEMNFGVTSGPMFLCSISEYPCMVFGYGKQMPFFRKCGINWGEPMPWCGPNQITVWDEDHQYIISKSFEQWQYQNRSST